jgi:hypothetical protein
MGNRVICSRPSSFVGPVIYVDYYIFQEALKMNELNVEIILEYGYYNY